jgi:malic enzyme
MFITAAKAVADLMTQEQLEQGLLYPPQTNILQTEVDTAIRVCEVIFDRPGGRRATEGHPGVREVAAVQARRDVERPIRPSTYRNHCPAAWTATNPARTNEKAHHDS